MIKKKKTLIIAILLITISLVTAACQLSSRLQESSNPIEKSPTTPPAVDVVPPTTPDIKIPNVVDQEDTLVSLYQQISPGVVSVQVINDSGSAQGSGFVVDKEGHIVTNYHVVENSESIEVDFSSGLKVYGEVIGTDPDSDLAVIRVDVPAEELVPLALGDSDQALVGKTVVAIGNPYGLSGTMTVGIVSARGRVLDSMRQTSDGIYFTAGDLIQTDTSINPGNSGGPLINLNGEVIGVNRAIQTSGTTLSGEAVNTGIGFAVSSNIVRRVLPSLISQGSYDYPYLGLSSLNSLNLSLQEVLGLPQANGAYISGVVAGGPAEQAGLVAGSRPTEISDLYAGGDLIIAVDGKPVNEFSDLLSYMLINKAPGDQIEFTILRDGEEMKITVTLGKRS